MFISRAPMAAIFKMDDSEAGWDCGHKTFLTLCNTLTRCLEGGYIRPIPLQIATMAIWSFVHGMASLHIRGRFKMFGDLDTEAAMYASLEQMILLIKA
ncbi:MAG: WHG domain-containing protein, partial [Cytophagaceae bacterium]|nr:WHG domain-containing protein [Cytophagaceae bacterium]